MKVVIRADVYLGRDVPVGAMVAELHRELEGFMFWAPLNSDHDPVCCILQNVSIDPDTEG